jgi:hypothetical protein
VAEGNAEGQFLMGIKEDNAAWLEETSRKTRLKRVRFPSQEPGEAGPYLDIPVIEEIEFKDPKKNNQVYRYRINNDAEADRKTHVKTIRNRSLNLSSTAKATLDVERIDEISFRDPKEFSNITGWETGYRLDNNDPPPSLPSGSPISHMKKHVVRYGSGSPDGVWIDSELIDEIEFKDPKDSSRELRFRLKNPPIGEAVEDDKNDPYFPTKGYISEDWVRDGPRHEAGEGVDPPWRFDPFQNVVNVKAGNEPQKPGTGVPKPPPTTITTYSLAQILIGDYLYDPWSNPADINLAGAASSTSLSEIYAIAAAAPYLGYPPQPAVVYGPISDLDTDGIFAIWSTRSREYWDFAFANNYPWNPNADMDAIYSTLLGVAYIILVSVGVE